MLRGVDEFQRARSFHLEYLAEEIFFVAFDSKDRVKEKREMFAESCRQHAFYDIVSDDVDRISFLRKRCIVDALCREIVL